MGNLIKNECIKVFKKKGTYIVLIIFLLFVILTNCLYKYMSNYISYDYRTDGDYINQLKSEINNIDVNADRQHYIDTKTDIDFYDLYKKYDQNSWQAYIVKRDFYNYIYNVNVYKYGADADKQLLGINPEDIYDSEMTKLENGNWKDYIKVEIDELNTQIAQLQAVYNPADDSNEMKGIGSQLENLKLRLELAEMRIDKDIPYANNFMNDAIDIRTELGNIDTNYNIGNMSYKDKQLKQQSIEKNELAKYTLETKQDIQNSSNLRGVLMNVFDEYSIFILIFIIMIAGSIVSSEFEKGTIKMLLVKPFTRGKILLSKYIVVLAMIPFIFLVAVILQVIVGGIILGFDSLSIPAVVYNFNTNSTVTYNIFEYVLLIAVNKLPIYILLATLAFTLSALFGNTVISIVLPILGNIASSIINQLAIMYSIKQLKVFPTLNWDFTQFLFGKLPQYEFTNLKFASCMCIVYFVIMVVIAWIAFRKREIKNI